MNWAFLGLATLVVFLPSVGLITGWVPRLLAYRPGPTRLLGASGTLLYAAILTEVVPSVASAPGEVRSAFAYAALGLVIIAILLSIIYDLKQGPTPSPWDC
ncbi:MAG: hypothetical protein WCD21_02380 [Streptomyces sp.]